MKPHGRKQPTKGANEIIDTNELITLVCQSLAIVPSIIRIAIYMIINIRSIKLSLSILTWDNVFSETLLPISILILSYLMKRLSKPLISEDGIILYAGYDLTVQGGCGQYLREIMVIIAAAHIFSVISPWFRHILWYLPIRGFYMSWKSTIVPSALKFLIDHRILIEGNEEQRHCAKPKKKKKIKYLRTIKHWHHFKC